MIHFIFFTLIQMCAIMFGLWMYSFLNTNDEKSWIEKTIIWMMGIVGITMCQVVFYVVYTTKVL